MKKYFLDAVLLILFLLVMSFHFLPRILHEIFGLIMLAAAVWHSFFNRRRFLNFFQGKQTKRKILSSLTNILIVIIFAVIFISGVCMSNYIFDDLIPLEIRRNMTIHRLHVSLPYVFMILIGVHIGLHWNEIWGRFTNFIKLKKNTPHYKFGSYIFLAVIICAGVYGAFLNRVGDRILMKHIFATPATEISWIAFLFLFLATMGIYSIIIYFVDKKFLK